MKKIVTLRTLALDSSQLGMWARDKYSLDKSRREVASKFETFLLDHGYIPFICWHHLVELFGTQNVPDKHVIARFLKSLPQVAYIASTSNGERIGAITDILALEAATSLIAAGPIAVRDAVATEIIKFETGNILFENVEVFISIESVLLAGQNRNREIVAITQSESITTPNMKVLDLLKAEISSPNEVSQNFSALLDSLTDSISTRGDRRIKEAATVASGFIANAKGFLGHSHPQNGSALLAEILEKFDVDPSTIDTNMTIKELNEWILFLRRLSVVWSKEQIRKTSSLHRDKIPNWIIDSALRDHRVDTKHRCGSEIGDRHLSALAAYADVTFVDRRIAESFRQWQQKARNLCALTNRVEKVTHYANVPAVLNKQL